MRDNDLFDKVKIVENILKRFAASRGLSTRENEMDRCSLRIFGFDNQTVNNITENFISCNYAQLRHNIGDGAFIISAVPWKIGNIDSDFNFVADMLNESLLIIR